MTRTKTIYLALLAVLLSPMAANADVIAGSISENDIPAELNGGFFIDVFSITVDTSTNINVMYDATDTLTPWFYYWGAEAFTSGTQLPVDVQGVSNIPTSNFLGQAFSAAAGGVANATINALPGVIYQVWATSYDYPPSTGAFGAYELTITADNLEAGLTVEQYQFGVTTVPEPGTLALLGLGLVGMAARRRKKV